MSRNAKYVKRGILSGDITTWEEVFELYKISWLALDVGMRVEKLRLKAGDIAEFKYGEIVKMAKLFGMTFHELNDFVLGTSNNSDFKRKK